MFPLGAFAVKETLSDKDAGSQGDTDAPCFKKFHITCRKLRMDLKFYICIL